MGRSARRMRRAAARALPRPAVQEVGPGVYDLAFPVPPGMPEAAVRAAFEEFRRTVLVELGVDLADPHVCTPGTCTHARKQSSPNDR